MPRPKLDSMLPSTSKAHTKNNESPTSPVSPTGRIAKRNAQLITEMDLKSKRSSVFSETMVGTVPDFDIYDIGEKCEVIRRILDSEDNTISSEHLNALQKQIEDLIADNADNQKRINGEITYLNTGEYPTDDLSGRLMPTYTLRTRTSLDGKRGNVAVESLADLGLNSSPEEDEENPSLVDVPRRFWNWTREYLRHVTEDYVVNFKERIVDRFSEESLQKYLQNGYTHKPPGCISGSERKISVSSVRLNGGGLSTLNGVCNGNGDAITPFSKVDRRYKRRLSTATDDCPISSKIRPPVESPLKRNSDALMVQAFAFVSQQNGNNLLRKTSKKSCNNGIEEEADDYEEEKLENGIDELFDTPKTKSCAKEFTSNGLSSNGVSPANSYLTPPPLTNGLKHLDTPTNGEAEPPLSILMNLRELGSAFSTFGVKKGLISSEFSLKNLLSGEQQESGNTDLEDNTTDESLDEVTREIKKKERELAQLATVTCPIIDSVYERIQAEYALYETSRRLDLADDKLFELGAKYDGVTTFTKEQCQECANALAAREKALRQFEHNFFKTSETTNSVGAVSTSTRSSIATLSKLASLNKQRLIFNEDSFSNGVVTAEDKCMAME